jgi:hypothetical protein
MAVIVADEGVVSFDNASDTLQDVSSDVINFQLAVNVNGGTYHTLADRWAKATEGGVSGTLTVTFVDDTTATELAGYLREWLLHASNKGGARSVRIQTPDGSSGSIQYDFEVKPGGNYGLASLTGGSGDVTQNSITMNVDGAITESTIA